MGWELIKGGLKKCFSKCGDKGREGGKEGGKIGGLKVTNKQLALWEEVSEDLAM